MGAATAVHDVSDGGILVALAEMAMQSGIGADLDRAPLAAHAFWFGEDQSRYILTAKATVADKIMLRGALRRRAGPPARLYRRGRIDHSGRATHSDCKTARAIRELAAGLYGRCSCLIAREDCARADN